ncbi:hypothetical protein [Microbacterium sp. SORGH_AS_0888]|uniref:DUF6907 domain-containing protein n=1 Tax=Microbacterium sp. SORGH_AS_0888 TaxID=3041791 RepID=UPI00277FEC07|nr:hypothetical protein [Microbacterium sp. SORGH_AS_0888]MDQ1130170.1 hypothetical protein [Microbacterium sp. SORGH_AS_0888]
MTDVPAPSPSSDPCPEWCCGDHDEEGYHQSCFEILPAVVPLPPGCDGEGRSEEATELSVAAYRYSHSSAVWVAITEGRQTLDVSLESARRLHACLARLLEQLERV